MKKLIAIIASALTLGAFAADQRNVPFAVDTTDYEPGTEIDILVDGEYDGTVEATGGVIYYQANDYVIGQQLAFVPKMAVNDTVTWSNLDSTEPFAFQFTKNSGTCSLTLTAKDECPVNSMVNVSSVVFPTGGTIGWPNTITINGKTSATKEESQMEESKTSGNYTVNRLITYTFETPAQVLVGTSYPITSSAALPITGVHDTSVIDLPGLSGWAGYQTQCSVSGTVASMPPEGPRTFTYGADGWDVEIPADYNADDSIVVAANGLTIDFIVRGALTIEDGVTVTLAPGAQLTYSKTTNNGSLKIVGGNESNPVIITEDGAVHSSIGAITIAANSTVKIISKGNAGAVNRKINVTGEDQNTSLLVMSGVRGWGMSSGTEIRTCTLIVSDQELWCEAPGYLNETVNVVLNKHLHYKTTGVIGKLSGSQNVTCDNDTPGSMTITMPGVNSTFSGTSNVPFILAGTGTFTYSGTNAKISLPGLASSDPKLTISNNNFAGTVEIAAIDVGSTKTGFTLAPYSKANSTLVLKGIAGDNLYIDGSTTFAGTVRIDGAVKFNNGSAGADYSFAKITGEGDLSLLNWGADNNNGHGYTITKLEGYTGTLTTTRHTTIAEIALVTEPAEGGKILTLGSTTDLANLVITKVTVGGEDAAFEIDKRQGGVYRAISVVPHTEPTTITATNWDFTQFTMDNGEGGTVYTEMIEGDTVVIPASLPDGQVQWNDAHGDVIVGHKIIVQKNLNWKHAIDAMTIDSGITVYLFNGYGLNSGATVDGDGTLSLAATNIPVKGPATIECASVVGTGSLKLADGATLTCAKLEEGDTITKVTTDVENSHVEYNDGVYAIVADASELPGEVLIDAEEKEAYRAWAEANGVTAETTTDHDVLAIAFHLDANKGDTYDTIEDAAQAKVKELVAQIDLNALAAEGETAALTTLNAELAEKGLVASLAPVELEGASESTKLYQLVIKLIKEN